jgi:hypothetical protein
MHQLNAPSPRCLCRKNAMKAGKEAGSHEEMNLERAGAGVQDTTATPGWHREHARVRKRQEKDSRTVKPSEGVRDEKEVRSEDMVEEKKGVVGKLKPLIICFGPERARRPKSRAGVRAGVTSTRQRPNASQRMPQQCQRTFKSQGQWTPLTKNRKQQVFLTEETSRKRDLLGSSSEERRSVYWRSIPFTYLPICLSLGSASQSSKVHASSHQRMSFLSWTRQISNLAHLNS